MLALVLLLAAGNIVAVVFYLRLLPSNKRDHIERKQSEQNERARMVLELLAHGAPLQQILHAIANEAEQKQPLMLCSIHLLDRDGRYLINGAAPSLPDYFSNALNNMEAGIGSASCGTAAFTGQRIIVEDVQTHPYWAAYREVARKAGLSSCWSEPLFSSDGKVLGTFAIYYRQVHRPTADEFRSMEQYIQLAEIALGRNHADRALKESEKLLSDILENVPAYIYLKDAQGRYLFANRLLRERFDAPMEEIVGYEDGKFYDADTAARMREEDLKVLREGVIVESEETNQNLLTGDVQVFMTVKLPLRHADGQIHALCGISTDISKRKEYEEHYQHMAQFDTLTHLPNRALFNDRLRQALASAQRNKSRLALMFIDLDRFKPVNDNYGHDVGDLLLQQVAQRIQDCLRESDTAARIGGDEFVVLLPLIEKMQDAGKVGEKILAALNQPFGIREYTLNIGSSIGIAVYPEHGTQELQLAKHADIAMYHAKNHGRNNVRIYSAGMAEPDQH